MDKTKFILFLLTGIKALTGNKSGQQQPVIENIDETLKLFGYQYEPEQDIFFSRSDCWQRAMGYCRLYDEAAAPASMVMDCEPIRFEYDGRRWMIELWKGQYGMTTGGEVGVYYTDREDIKAPGIFNGAFYKCAEDADMLDMSFTLYKNGEEMFHRAGKHWWLTGFKLGEFSEPSELSMDVSITLKDKEMTDAFLRGLEEAGYQPGDYTVNGNTVQISFVEPRTQQPFTRMKKLGIETMSQLKNNAFCTLFQKLSTGNTSLERLYSLKEKNPQLFDQAVSIGKPRYVYAMYPILSKYLELAELLN